MKQIVLILICLLPMGVHAQFDDVYFVPKKRTTISSEESSEHVTTQTRLGESYGLRDEDEYNRRPSSSSSYSYEDEEVYTAESEDVYNNDEEDYRFSTRIVRFHSPRRVVVSSPWYWEVYSSGYDSWTVYDNGTYIDLYPSYDYFYEPSWSFAFYSGWWGFTLGSHWYHHHHHHHWNHAWHGPYVPHYGHDFSGGHVHNRRPVFGNMRTANGNIGRPFGTSNSSLRGTKNSSDERVTTVKRGGSSSGVRATAVKRGTSSSNERATTVKRGGSSSDERVTTVKRGSSSKSSSTRNVRRSSDNDGKTYNRPSSTRSTSQSGSVSRSSSRSDNRSSVSRSSGGSSRSSGVSSRGSSSRGSSSRGSSSRGGRR